MTTPAQQLTLAMFADRVALVVTDLNGLISRIVNEEVMPADFDDDLMALFGQLNRVEEEVAHLMTRFGE